LSIHQYSCGIVFKRPNLLAPAIAGAVRIVLVGEVAAVVLSIADVVYVNAGATLVAAQESQLITRISTPDMLFESKI
jgi:hypothetical protein